jgi:hypothetical protein
MGSWYNRVHCLVFVSKFRRPGQSHEIKYDMNYQRNMPQQNSTVCLIELYSITKLWSYLKRDGVKRFFASGFFHESISPKPLEITLGFFQILLTNSRRSLQVKVPHAPVSMNRQQIFWYQRQRGQIVGQYQTDYKKHFLKILIEDFFPLPPNLSYPWAANFSENFRKNPKRPDWNTQELEVI